MKHKQFLLRTGVLATVLGLGLGLAACEEKTSMEKAQESAGDAMEHTGDAMEEQAEDMKEGAEEMGDDMEEATDGDGY